MATLPRPQSAESLEEASSGALLQCVIGVWMSPMAGMLEQSERQHGVPELSYYMSVGAWKPPLGAQALWAWPGRCTKRISIWSVVTREGCE